MKTLSKLWVVFICCLSGSLQAQTLTQWTETAGPLGLGYPVPVPVDTPLPFDGFRTYAALHSRHQDLQQTTDSVHGQVIGQTRQGRDIWAYRLGDADLITRDGLPEPAILINGGIHAREWQSPEVVTGVMELLAGNEDDDFLYRYLLDNVNVVLIPVMNIDGFLQTQRYPDNNYLNSQPSSPTSPRDGRMRRKNMLSVDEDLFTVGDHLFGVDMNRNNPPFWASNPSRSSSDPNSIVHHGQSGHSEPEGQALADAANLGPADQLRMYTDVHSFSQVLFSVRTFNITRNTLQARLLADFSTFHAAYPGNKVYFDLPNNSGVGIGSTDEYHAYTYEIPSFTLEVEPSGGNHPGLPGCGADYGGLASNCHDGFILPEAEISRVRQQLAETFAVAFYRQAGPPAIAAMRIVDDASGAVVYEAEWDATSGGLREQYQKQLRNLQADHDYTLWIAWNKPMRWRENGVIAPLQGQLAGNPDPDISIQTGGVNLNINAQDGRWLDQPGDAPDGYFRYRDDAYAVKFSISADTAIADNTPLIISVNTADMLQQTNDANPATAISWSNGGWSGYENINGVNGISGGTDRTVQPAITAASAEPPYLLEPGVTSLWFDPDQLGQGFLVEILADGRAVVYWFTYDTEGEQRWYLGVGEIRGNRILVPELLTGDGGDVNDPQNPENIVISSVGSAQFIWDSCSEASVHYTLGNDTGRMSLTRLTRVMGITCLDTQEPITEHAILSGAWFQSITASEGIIVQVLRDQRVIVFWFTFDQGKPRWLYGEGHIDGSRLVFPDISYTRGGIFGPDYDGSLVEFIPWGDLELDLQCLQGSGSFSRSTPSNPTSETSALSLNRLTRLAGLKCE